MLSHFSCVQLCDCSLPGSSAHGILQQEHWSGLPCPPPGDLPDPGIELESLMSPALAGGFFTSSATWEAWLYTAFPSKHLFLDTLNSNRSQCYICEEELK